MGRSTSQADRRLTRRQALGLGAGAAGTIALGGWGVGRLLAGDEAPVDHVLRAAPTTIELGPRSARTWAYAGGVPGPELRLKQGQPFRARVENRLPSGTTIHWHGIRLDNAMDGVPDLTQRAISPGDDFVYEFTPPDAGTFIYHSHVGTQLDRGLYGALIVEPRREEMSYDREAVLLLDDWLDGVAGTPDRRLADLRRNGMNMPGMGGMSMGGGMDGMKMGAGMGGQSMGGAMGGQVGRHSALSGGRPGPDSLAALANAMETGRVDPGDVRHPLHLVNGRPPADPPAIAVRHGERLRLRLINPAADTVYCVFIEDHQLSVTHADGQPVSPVTTDAIMIGMGERYDALVEARAPGAVRLIAVPLGKPGRAVATLRYGEASRSRMPRPDAPFRAPRRVASYEDLRPLDRARSPSAPRELRLDLGMAMDAYRWTIAGRAFPDAPEIELAPGERVRLRMRNRTPMPHPMHLHGHFFRQALPGGAAGPEKDTILVPPMREVAVDLVADNPGRWAFHCHNAYHQEAGMMRSVRVGSAARSDRRQATGTDEGESMPGVGH